MATINAYKMDGLGNDFIIIDRRSSSINLTKDQIIELGKRNNIGFDQIIFIEKEKEKSFPIAFGFPLAINSLVTGSATSASNKANRISFKPESTCSSVNEGALLSLEKILSNLFVKFSNIFITPNTYRTSGRTFAD